MPLCLHGTAFSVLDDKTKRDLDSILVTSLAILSLTNLSVYPFLSLFICVLFDTHTAVPPKVPSYKGNPNCTGGHRPWPYGICSKCMPENATLQIQVSASVCSLSFAFSASRFSRGFHRLNIR